jgi:polyisoprenoid-binding protein YceI
MGITDASSNLYIKNGFKVTGTINRKDFGLTWNAALEAGGVAVSEDVKLDMNIELNKG